MTSATANSGRRRWGRSVAAVFCGILATAIPSLATDHLFHVIGVYPPWGEPMHDHGLNALALSYRIVYGILGGFVAAMLAPRAPMRHALVLGAIGVVLSTLGAFAAWEMGPAWFPLSLILIALPCAWAGGKLEALRVSARK